MKRIISGILGASIAAAMVVGLTGCGGSSKDSNTLVWYMMGDKPAAHDAVMAKANEIIEPAIGMKLDMQYIDGASFTEKMKMKMASGDAYDLTFTGYINPYQTAVQMGGLYDITSLIAETGLDQVIPQYYLDTATVDGKIYGIPNIQVISNPADVEILQSVAEECGVTSLLEQIDELSSVYASYDDMVKVMDLYTEMFAKVKEKRPDLYTWNPNNNLAFCPVYEEVVDGIALRRDGTSTKMVPIHETEEWKLGVKKIGEWYNSGYIRNDIASVGNSLATDEERLQVGFQGGTWKPGQDVYQKNRYGEVCAYTLCLEPYVSRTSALLTMISVGAKSKHPKEAVELIKLINTDKDLFNILCWGIEGEQYKKNEDGTVVAIEGGGYENVGQSAWKFGNQFNGFVSEGQPADVWELTEKMNDEAIKSPMIGFVPNTDSIQTEIANISNINAEYKAKREFGTEDMSTWYDEYSSKLEKAGIQEVLEEMQKQYDAWLATK